MRVTWASITLCGCAVARHHQIPISNLIQSIVITCTWQRLLLQNYFIRTVNYRPLQRCKYRALRLLWRLTHDEVIDVKGLSWQQN